MVVITNLLKIFELHIYNGLILWYLNYTSVELWKEKGLNQILASYETWTSYLSSLNP